MAIGAKRARTNFTENQKAEIYARDRARGGKSTIDNGACVSSTFNAKKRANGSDNLCFFLEGHITRDFVAAFGLPGEGVMRDLDRRAALVPADWWFNRALANSLFALSWRAGEVFGDPPRRRDDEYWMRSALRRHRWWLQVREPGSYAARGLLAEPMPFGSALLVALEDVETASQYREWLETLWPSLVATKRARRAFDDAESDEECVKALESGGGDADVNH